MGLDVVLKAVRPTAVYENNITHNLNRLAEAVGLYYPLWRPEEINIKQASQLIPFLEAGLYLLKTPTRSADWQKFEPPNGWGSAVSLVNFTESYLQACRDNPDAEISVWR
jgi:hypothetical protein